MKKLYVGNISYSTTEEQLAELFAKYGKVESVNVVTNKYTGRSKGFAFVELDPDGAEQAIAALDGTEFEGRTLKVAEARPRPD